MDREYQNTLTQHLLQSFPGECTESCIQCGTCSGSCPLARDMDIGPRRILALLRDSYLEEVLRSRSIWLCVSCNACLTRCPQGVPVPDIMYLLRLMAMDNGLAHREYKMPHLFQSFVRQVEKRGRVSESRLAASYGLLHPGDAVSRLGLGLKLLTRGRI
ncbi:4Fe-4S dicluster domain-containing protein [Desulfonatronospira sp.]|uniref:4Fe-4S dicluster domain-containing protein n=1 Tax=Desulfonatronospira sp. TaxID=1962951 RepID=UPI0025BF2DD1|nr:4Fe-4S dicluster domain-containing protein [Desulfonatronospira sp.]